MPEEANGKINDVLASYFGASGAVGLLSLGGLVLILTQTLHNQFGWAGNYTAAVLSVGAAILQGTKLVDQTSSLARRVGLGVLSALVIFHFAVGGNERLSAGETTAFPGVAMSAPSLGGADTAAMETMEPMEDYDPKAGPPEMVDLMVETPEGDLVEMRQEQKRVFKKW